MAVPRVVAMGGGGFLTEPENPLLDDHLLSLTGSALPRVCFVPTASGDSEDHVSRFLEAFPADRADASVLSLFKREVTDLRSFVLQQDVVYVGGGSTANLLAVWRTHRLHSVLAEAYEAGVVMAGVSAGMNCWFEASVTDSFDVNGCDPLADGLGLLAGSACPHYDGEPQRRPCYQRLVRTGFLGGYAAEDGAALVFEDGQLSEVVTSRPDANAFHLSREDGQVAETRLPARYLGSAQERLREGHVPWPV